MSEQKLSAEDIKNAAGHRCSAVTCGCSCGRSYAKDTWNPVVSRHGMYAPKCQCVPDPASQPAPRSGLITCTNCGSREFYVDGGDPDGVLLCCAKCGEQKLIEQSPAPDAAGERKAIADAQHSASHPVEGKARPDGYVYRYPDGIRFSNGQTINGSEPIEAIPYFFRPTLPDAETLAKDIASKLMSKFTVFWGPVERFKHKFGPYTSDVETEVLASLRSLVEISSKEKEKP